MANIFTASFSKAGHKAVCSLVGGHEHARCTVGELTEALQASYPEVSEEVVRSALRQGCFDTAKRNFYDVKGRYGGIREMELEGEAQAQAEVQRQDAEKGRTKRQAGAKAKAPAKAPAKAKTEPEVQPSV